MQQREKFLKFMSRTAKKDNNITWENMDQPDNVKFLLSVLPSLLDKEEMTTSRMPDLKRAEAKDPVRIREWAQQFRARMLKIYYQFILHNRYLLVRNQNRDTTMALVEKNKKVTKERKRRLALE